MFNIKVVEAYTEGLEAGQRFIKNNEPLKYPYPVGSDEYNAYTDGVLVSVNFVLENLF